MHIYFITYDDVFYMSVIFSQLIYGLGDSSRLFPIYISALPGFYVAEAAAPGACITKDHKSECARPPALPYVRTPGLFTNGVQVEGLYKAS